MPPEFVEKWLAYAQATAINPAAIGLASLALAIILFWPRVSRRVPGPFVALLVTTAIAHAFSLPVETIGSRFGDITASVPQPPHGVEVYEINGPFFFGAAETFKDTLARVSEKPRVLIIRMRSVLALDSTGMHALKDVVHRSRKDGAIVLLSDVHMQPLVALTGSPVLAEIGQDKLFGNLDDALNYARRLVGVPEEQPPRGTEPTVEREKALRP